MSVTAVGSPSRSIPVDPISELYAELAPRLRLVVAAHSDFPATVVDDACQIAWAALLADPDAVDATRRLGWLATTARREAVELMRRRARDAALEVAEGTPAPSSVDAGCPPRVAEFWDEMARLRRLPPRQRTLVWLHGLGYDYREIARRTGSTERAVERQLLQARRRLRDAA